MSPRTALPFPRGGTAGDFGNEVTLSDTTFSHLEGRIYEVPDTKHGTGQNILLRAVKNDTGSAIVVARKFMGFSTTSDYDFGRRSSGFAGAGAVCKPLDDAYAIAVSIPKWDVFYVIERGPADVQTETAGVDLPAGSVVASDASGLVNGTACAQATEYSAGAIGPAAAAVDTVISVQVDAGLKQIGT